MCQHRIAGGELVCTRTDPHDPDAPGGHIYQSNSGSDVDDRHPEGGHG